jgi:hypothetical protein
MVLRMEDILAERGRGSAFDRNGLPGPILVRDQLIAAFPEEIDANVFTASVCARFDMKPSQFSYEAGQVVLHEGSAGVVKQLQVYAYGWEDRGSLPPKAA